MKPSFFNALIESYGRVLPRDFFNEAKLLKCMGQLSLLIHDNQAPPQLTIEHDGSPFQIELNDTGLFIANVQLMLHGEELPVFTLYNNKGNFPLLAHTEEHGPLAVFEENGAFSQDFLAYVNSVPSAPIDNDTE